MKFNKRGIKNNMKKSNLYFSVTDNYKNMSDEDLITVIKSGDKFALEFLIEKYKELVNMKVSKFFMIGAEKEDIVQEGLIGLFKRILHIWIIIFYCFK